MNVLIPKNRGLLVSHAREQKFQIALLFQARIRQRGGRRPPQYLPAPIGIFHHQRFVGISVERIRRRVGLPASVSGQRNLRRRARDRRRRQRSRFLPFRRDQRYGLGIVLWQKRRCKQTSRNHAPTG